MGVLVDVKKDGDIQLGRPIRGQAAEVLSEGKPVEAL
jgi:hypothetical protein